jgi:SAM-dependent methyltransferase
MVNGQILLPLNSIREFFKHFAYILRIDVTGRLMSNYNFNAWQPEGTHVPSYGSQNVGWKGMLLLQSPGQLNVSSLVRAARFPAVGFRSYEAFQSYLRDHQSSLDAHYEYELSLATLDATLTCKGTCASCLRPTTFSSTTGNGTTIADGRRIPNWREQMRCDCEHRLIARQRAAIHFLQATVLTSWTRLLMFGPPGEADYRLESLVETITKVPALRRSAEFTGAPPAPILDAPSGKFHAVVSQDYLQFVPPLQAAFTEILRVLAPGGRFIFTIPFYFAEATSMLITMQDLSFAREMPMEFQGSQHKLGWDLLAFLTQAGFREATAYLYWSEELGYLGSMNFLFKAVK